MDKTMDSSLISAQGLCHNEVHRALINNLTTVLTTSFALVYLGRAQLHTKLTDNMYSPVMLEPTTANHLRLTQAQTASQT